MSENEINKEDEIKEMKKCFIITPIGKTSDPIFRHINGVIDECIEPVLKNKYEIIVAHRINKPGSIYKQIIKEIFEADLVIANLTNTNPNVMYELAFRHAINKPVIMIMEKGDYNLPFDVISERTIFYDNDFQGAIELKKQLANMLESIEKESKEGFSPIYDVLKSIGEINYVKNKINSIKPEEKTELQYIIDRLEEIDSKIERRTSNKMNHESKVMAGVTKYRRFIIDLKYNEAISYEDKINIQQEIIQRIQVKLGKIFIIQVIQEKDSIALEIETKENADFIGDTRAIISNIIESYIREANNNLVISFLVV